MVEKSGVEKFLLALGLKSSWLKSSGLESSWLKSPGLKGMGLKLGVEKSGVQISLNQIGICNSIKSTFLLIVFSHVCHTA